MVDQLGPLTYQVQMEKEDLWRRHVDHIWTAPQPRTSTQDTASEPAEGEFADSECPVSPPSQPQPSIEPSRSQDNRPVQD